jgi:hypothetical protein
VCALSVGARNAGNLLHQYSLIRFRSDGPEIILPGIYVSFILDVLRSKFHSNKIGYFMLDAS